MQLRGTRFLMDGMPLGSCCWNTALGKVRQDIMANAGCKIQMTTTEEVEQVLIVDDEIEFVSTVRRHLKRLGLKPDAAYDGEDARHKMLAVQRDGRRYDLVITDVVMPRMDGIELMHWIHDTFPDTSVIMVSEFMDLAHLEARIRPELDDIGRKPITPELMMRLIGGISRKRAIRRQTERPHNPLS
jgi:two-component system response regulator YesN